MGVRCHFDDGKELKLHGHFAKAAMELGFLTESVEYPGSFEEVNLFFNRLQIEDIHDRLTEYLEDGVPFSWYDLNQMDIILDWILTEDNQDMHFC